MKYHFFGAVARLLCPQPCEMEGIAAYGVACNIMQTIHFSIAVAALCKDLYEGRSPDEDIENRRVGLQDAVRNLRPASLITSNADQIEEQQLHTLAKKLINAADNLEKELAQFKTNSQGSRRHAAKNSIKYTFGKKRKIDTLNQLLQDCQKEMETRILVRLRYARCYGDNAPFTNAF